MREDYRVRLAAVGELLSAMAEAAGTAMRGATRGLLRADRAAAEGVIADRPGIEVLRTRVEETTYELLALQAPVASDLRTVVTAQHVATDLDRMGNLAQHVASTALRRYPEPALVPELTGVFAGMSDAAARMVDKLHDVIVDRDARLAAELDADDDVLDTLHRKMFTILFDPGWKHGTEAAVDAALLGRYYERFADHTVSIAAQVIYLVTGEYDQQP